MSSDYYLVKELKNNSLEAFKKVYYKYYKLVYFQAYQILNNKEDAEDVMQNTFLKFMNKINTRVEIVDVDQLPENYEEVNPNALYRITREIEGAYNGLLIVYDIDATLIPTEVPASLYLVNSLPDKGVPSPEVGYLNINLYKVISEENASYAYINNEWQTGFTYIVVNDRTEVNPEPEAGYFLITGNKSNSIIYTLNGQDTEGKPTFKNITDAIVDVEWLPHINEADAGKIYRIPNELHGTLYVKNADGLLSINTFNDTPVNILIVDTLPEKGRLSSTEKAFIYCQKSDNRLYWMLIENDGWQELSEANITYQIITSIDEIVEYNFPYVMVSGDGVKKVEGGFYVWDGEWKKLVTTDLLEYELNNKASTMLAADEKRLAAYEGSTRRPFDQSLFDALKNQYRVYNVD